MNQSEIINLQREAIKHQQEIIDYLKKDIPHYWWMEADIPDNWDWNIISPIEEEKIAYKTADEKLWKIFILLK